MCPFCLIVFEAFLPTYYLHTFPIGNEHLQSWSALKSKNLGVYLKIVLYHFFSWAVVVA